MENKNQMEFTGIRVVPNKTPQRIYEDHIARYEFASKYAIDKKVLDIACGTGYGSEYLIQHGAANVTGVDIAEDSIKYAIDHYAQDNLLFLESDATLLPFSEGSFDVIVSFETIEHIEKWKNYLEEISRVLKENGYLLISTPNRIVTSPNYPEKKSTPDNSFHVVEFSKDEFISLLARNFKEIEIFGQRMLNGVFFNPIIRKIVSRVFNRIYFESGYPEVKEIACFKIPRYFIAVCRKR